MLGIYYYALNSLELMPMTSSDRLKRFQNNFLSSNLGLASPLPVGHFI